jgi:RNAse (barnase) inhibitor barstar
MRLAAAGAATYAWGVSKPVLEIEGAAVTDLDTFYDEVSRRLIPGSAWGRNLDAFNDILRGGFGTPDEGFVLRWRDSALSQAALGYSATTAWLESKRRRCHPSHVPDVDAELLAAREGRGPTLFDILLEIIREHGPGGAEAEDGVELVLA